ncbi:MAG: UvrD-helicase domain-containing protein [Parcubacteria group bacterium]|nr:UvrD-helicase domain-containing protein [Parcubacteria group bacterium]
MTEKLLNSKQKEAVLHKDGPLLIVAGAGTGKTRVITERIARLMSEGVPGDQILAVTFTNKAAEEMRERVCALLERENLRSAPFFIEESPFIGTFHSLGVRILREHGKNIGIKKNFSIKDREDSLRLIREAIRVLSLDPKQYTPSKIQSIISKHKGNLRSVEEFREEFGNNGFFMLVARIWELYDASLAKENSLDFDDLIFKTVTLFVSNADVLKQYQNQWHYIHIDEYQDTNEAQYRISRFLAARHGNICVVGDSDQNIYSWRGANIQNILRFEEDYPGARVILLEENYRSTKIILDAANEVIKKNTLRKEKNLFTRKTEGEKIALFGAYNEADEAEFVVGTIQKIIDSGTVAEHVAVLYRANFQSRALEEACLKYSIPYQIIGTKFFERKEVKDVISFIGASLNPESLSDIKRIINVPPRGIGKATIAKIFSGNAEKLPPTMREKVKKFYTLLQKIKHESEIRVPSDLVNFIVKESELEEYLKNEGDDGYDRLQNIKELAALASRYDILPKEERLSKFLSDVALASDQDAIRNEKKGVRLMTVHAAKGLEFQRVFVTGLEQGLFPYERKFDDEPASSASEDGREEERRLFYVALTRAKEKIYLSFAMHRTLFGASYDSLPSEFFNDIPQELLEPIHETRAEKTIYLD